ncbi:MAG TPA: sulfatase-like hydrolase/transferase [Actinopolymorphaceae bacterium]|jgi:arylsulfatase A-like enzyme
MPQRPPNVLVIMSDEQRWDTLGSNGNPAARTPHLDALAERATSFDECHTPFPLCCPSRASLWTGLMPRHHHVMGNWRLIAPQLRDRSLATAFADAGYHTIYNGKWHVPGTTPKRMGFADTSAIPAVLNGRDRGRYIEEYRAYATARGYELVPGNIENLTARDLAHVRRGVGAPMCGTAEIALEDYLETWQTEQFRRALDRRPTDRPFFAVCSYNAPHFPMVVPRPYDRIIDRAAVRLPASFTTGPDTKPREVRESHFAADFAHLTEEQWVEVVAHYYGFCSLIDAQVGAILDHLRRAGELDRTIVVFTSDHGDMMGAHRLMEKGHLLHYDEVTRVPLLVAHPDAGAGRSSNLVSMVDIAVTIAELAGVAFCPGDGRSFAGMLGGGGAPTREYVTTETCLYDMESEANGQYNNPADLDLAKDALNLSVRTSTMRYIFRSHDIDELYDHTTDPHDQRNVAADEAYAAQRDQFRALLAAEIGDVFPEAAKVLAG